jgi:hypothetical protein
VIVKQSHISGGQLGDKSIRPCLHVEQFALN